MENNRMELTLDEMEEAVGGVDRVPGTRKSSENGGIIGMIVDLIKGLFD